MKRFDFANDVAKQLMTITSAIITVVIAFYEKFFSHHWLTFLLVFVLLFIFIISVVLGVLAIGGLVNLVARQEREDASATPGATKPFIELHGSGAQSYAMWQQGLFAFGLLMFAGIAVVDRLWLTPTMASAAAAHSPIVWTQLRPDTGSAKGELIARAIVAREVPCPALTVDGANWPMETRADGTDTDFPIRMCEAAIPGGAKASIGGTALKPRPAKLRKIVVIGDTGCRITDYIAQACDRAADWPFFRVAAAAAKLNPDLIIHVGDYHYREKPCAGQPGCTGSPYGDTWATWNADFFAPAGALLTAAPWLAVRGNHEDCTRAGAGWTLLLRPELGVKPDERCPADTDPYMVAFKGLRMVVLDSASVERYRRDKRVLTYRKQLRDKNERIGAPLAAGEQAWLLLHHPLWGSYGSKEGKAYVETDLYTYLVGSTPWNARNRLCQEIVDPVDSYRAWLKGYLAAKPETEDACAKLDQAVVPLPSPGFAMVLAGHVHNFQMFAPDDGAQPIQMIAGNSGDDLETGFATATGKFDVQPATLFGREGKLSARNTFGFTVLERPDDSGLWVATLYDPDGKIMGRCQIAAGETCTDEPR